MENYIIIGIIAVLVVLAILRGRKHFSGGGCCGSGGGTIRDKKVLSGPVIGSRVLTVEGMTCDNCAARVENAVGRFQGAVCHVDLKKKTATVEYSAEPDWDAVKQAIEKLGYRVAGEQDA